MVYQNASFFRVHRNIETIEDLKSVQVRLSSLYELAQDDIFFLSRSIKDILTNLDSDTSDLKRIMSRLRYSDEDYKKDIKKLDNLERIVKDFLR
jgi:predicted transcriptional regulator